MELRKNLLDLGGLKKLDCLLFFISVNFKAKVEADESYVDYWKACN